MVSRATGRFPVPARGCGRRVRRLLRLCTDRLRSQLSAVSGCDESAKRLDPARECASRDPLPHPSSGDHERATRRLPAGSSRCALRAYGDRPFVNATPYRASIRDVTAAVLSMRLEALGGRRPALGPPCDRPAPLGRSHATGTPSTSGAVLLPPGPSGGSGGQLAPCCQVRPLAAKSARRPSCVARRPLSSARGPSPTPGLQGLQTSP